MRQRTGYRMSLLILTEKTDPRKDCEIRHTSTPNSQRHVPPSTVVTSLNTAYQQCKTHMTQYDVNVSDYFY